MELIYFLLGVIAGAVTSWLFALQSGKDLRAETARLRKLHSITLDILADAFNVRLLRDEHGEITGKFVSIRGSLNVVDEPDTIVATGEVRDPEPKPGSASS